MLRSGGTRSPAPSGNGAKDPKVAQDLTDGFLGTLPYFLSLPPPTPSPHSPFPSFASGQSHRLWARLFSSQPPGNASFRDLGLRL